MMWLQPVGLRATRVQDKTPYDTRNAYKLWAKARCPISRRNPARFLSGVSVIEGRNQKHPKSTRSVFFYGGRRAFIEPKELSSRYEIAGKHMLPFDLPRAVQRCRRCCPRGITDSFVPVVLNGAQLPTPAVYFFYQVEPQVLYMLFDIICGVCPVWLYMLNYGCSRQTAYLYYAIFTTIISRWASLGFPIFEARLLQTTKRVPPPNDSSWENSRQHLSSTTLSAPTLCFCRVQ